MQKADGQSVKALFNFAGCGEWGLGFCFWQLRCGPKKMLLRTKRCVLLAANWVVMRYIKLCPSVSQRAIRSPKSGKLLCKIRKVAAGANYSLLMARLILMMRQTATWRVPPKEQ